MILNRSDISNATLLSLLDDDDIEVTIDTPLSEDDVKLILNDVMPDVVSDYCSVYKLADMYNCPNVQVACQPHITYRQACDLSYRLLIAKASTITDDETFMKLHNYLPEDAFIEVMKGTNFQFESYRIMKFPLIVQYLKNVSVNLSTFGRSDLDKFVSLHEVACYRNAMYNFSRIAKRRIVKLRVYGNDQKYFIQFDQKCKLTHLFLSYGEFISNIMTKRMTICISIT